MIRRSPIWVYEEPSINLTPLIDVVFVILISFMIIAPLLQIDQIELAQGPSDGSTNVKDQGPIAIYVTRDNKIRFNQQEVSLEQLLFLLKNAKAKHPNATPQVFHDQKAFFGTYQNVKNMAENAGFEQMDIVLNPRN